jgi:hypothetical protein
LVHFHIRITEDVIIAANPSSIHGISYLIAVTWEFGGSNILYSNKYKYGRHEKCSYSLESSNIEKRGGFYHY